VRIHAHDSDAQVLYTTDTQTVRQHGILMTANPGIGPRYHLPRRFWRKERLTYKPPYLTAEVLIVAREDESSEVQLSLTL
jgi:hypothetical protein